MPDNAPELTDEIEKGHRVRSFFEIEARTLQDRYRVIETLLPNSHTRGAAHRGEEGRFIESLLRDFLNKHLPNNIKAVSGFILCPSTKTGISNIDRLSNYPDRHSSQIDIIVYDFDSYPVYERFEEFCIVPPEGVVGLISVKKTLYPQDISAELVSLRKAAKLCAHQSRRGPYTGIFSFSSSEDNNNKLNEKIYSAIKEAYIDGGDFDTFINEVSVMNKTCAFKMRSNHSEPNKALYVGVDCQREVHVPLQRIIQSILSVYYDVTRASNRERPGFVSFRRSTFRSAPIMGYVDYQSLRSVET